MRITGGVLRSRAVRAPKGDTTRPTSDRVREALFSMLGADSPIAGARVLDLYAGTGALAFEAISRGAVHATLVEKNRAALAIIAENRKALDLEQVVRVHATPVEKFASLLRAELGEPFDLIFADPPYADIPNGVVTAALDPIFTEGLRAGRISPEARFVVEHASRDEPPAFESLELVRKRTYGDTAVAIFVSRSVG